jgi:hypothetical protein
LRHQYLGGGHEMLLDITTGSGDSTHRIGDMAVEPREKPEAVLSRQGLTAARRRVGHGKRSSLAAKPVAAVFVHVDVKAALAKFMRSTQSGNTATEDCNRGHCPTIRLNRVGNDRIRDSRNLTRTWTQVI